MMIHGPSGEALAKRYAPAESAMGPNALASNGPRVGTTTVEAPQSGLPEVSDVPQGAPYQVPGGAAMKLSDLRSSAAAAQTQQASAQPQTATDTVAPPGPPAASQAGPLGYAMKGIDPATGKEVQGAAYRDAQGNIAIMLPGSKGSPGGLTELGKKALENQTAAEAEYEKQRKLEDDARQAGVDAAKQEAEERQSFLEEQRTQNMLAAQNQQDEIDKQTTAVSKLQSSYEAARDDFMNSKVDPDAYLKGGGGSTALFSMLGMAMGAFGATLGRTPNFAENFVQSQIERNIRSQEAQINVKGKAADNMLADLTRSLGDKKLAVSAMRQMLTERAAIEAQQVGASSKSAQIQANATEVAAKLASQAAIQDNVRKQQFLEHVMTNPLYYKQGRAGSAPRMALPTQESMGKRQDAQSQGREESRKDAELAIKIANEGAGGKGSPLSGDRAQAFAAFGEGIAAANAIEAELKRRKVTQDATDDPTAGLYDRATQSHSNELLNQNTTALAKGVQSAFGKSDRDAADAQAMATGGGSGRDRLEAAARLKGKLIRQARTDLSTMTPAQQKALLSTYPADVAAEILGQ